MDQIKFNSLVMGYLQENKNWADVADTTYGNGDGTVRQSEFRKYMLENFNDWDGTDDVKKQKDLINKFWKSINVSSKLDGGKKSKLTDEEIERMNDIQAAYDAVSAVMATVSAPSGVDATGWTQSISDELKSQAQSFVIAKYNVEHCGAKNKNYEKYVAQLNKLGGDVNMSTEDFLNSIKDKVMNTQTALYSAAAYQNQAAKANDFVKIYGYEIGEDKDLQRLINNYINENINAKAMSTEEKVGALIDKLAKDKNLTSKQLAALKDATLACLQAGEDVEGNESPQEALAKLCETYGIDKDGVIAGIESINNPEAAAALTSEQINAGIKEIIEKYLATAGLGLEAGKQVTPDYGTGALNTLQKAVLTKQFRDVLTADDALTNYQKYKEIYDPVIETFINAKFSTIKAEQFATASITLDEFKDSDEGKKAIYNVLLRSTLSDKTKMSSALTEIQLTSKLTETITGAAANYHKKAFNAVIDKILEELLNDPDITIDGDKIKDKDGNEIDLADKIAKTIKDNINLFVDSMSKLNASNLAGVYEALFDAAEAKSAKDDETALKEHKEAAIKLLQAYWDKGGEFKELIKVEPNLGENFAEKINACGDVVEITRLLGLTLAEKSDGTFGLKKDENNVIVKSGIMAKLSNVIDATDYSGTITFKDSDGADTTSISIIAGYGADIDLSAVIKDYDGKEVTVPSGKITYQPVDTPAGITAGVNGTKLKVTGTSATDAYLTVAVLVNGIRVGTASIKVNVKAAGSAAKDIREWLLTGSVKDTYSSTLKDAYKSHTYRCLYDKQKSKSEGASTLRNYVKNYLDTIIEELKKDYPEYADMADYAKSTTMSYFESAIAAMPHWNGSKNHRDCAEGNAFNYTYYKPDGTTEQRNSSDQSWWKQGADESDSDSISDFSGTSATGIYIGEDYNSWGRDNDMTIHVDQRAILEKFLSFLA